jgi:hypothetical protein
MLWKMGDADSVCCRRLWFPLYSVLTDTESIVMRSDVVLKVLLNFKLFPRFACVSQEGGKAGGLIMTIVENGTAVTYALRVRAFPFFLSLHFGILTENQSLSTQFQKDADRVSFHSRLRKHAPPTE